MYKQKEQELSRVRDKNKRITEILTELEMREDLWEPSLTDSERPERALTVLDSEVTTLESRMNGGSGESLVLAYVVLSDSFIRVSQHFGLPFCIDQS